MAQESMVETLEPSASSVDQSIESLSMDSVPSLSRNTSLSRLNARAPEFVPRNPNPIPIRSDLVQQPRLVIQQTAPPPPIHVFPGGPFPVPYHHNYGGGGGGGGGGAGGGGREHLEFVHQPEQLQPPQPLQLDHVPSTTRNGLPDEVSHKIMNQVEYYFSDANLATTDHLMRFITKDPDGFVPMSVVASFKKIKALVSSHHQLATVLRKSSKLVVSDDGKKVRRQNLFTESDMEELQSRIIVAENLPEDHSYQNLMRVFSVVGSVKTIRTCPPQISNGGASTTSRLSKVENMFFCNKLHAFVEYETVELAEKAAAELNNEKNWRSGLKVRLLLKRTSKSTQARTRRAGHEIVGEGNGEEDDLSTSEQPNGKHPEDHFQTSDGAAPEHIGEENVSEKESGQRRMRGRGRGKGRGGRNQHHRGHNNPLANNLVQTEPNAATKQQPPGPRMPDGTRGFTMGRGKPLVTDHA